MTKIQQLIIMIIFKSIPLTHLYKFKAKLLQIIYKKISSNAKIVSSVKFLGISNIEIGDDTFIGHETMIIGASDTKVKIGSYCDISSRVMIITGTHEIDLEGLHIAGNGIGKDITINDGVWIGAHVTLLPGVKIGTKSIIAAGAVVIHDVPANVMVAGNPAVIKKRLV